MSNIVIDPKILETQLLAFQAYVHDQDGNTAPLDFYDKEGCLSFEAYKYDILSKAQEAYEACDIGRILNEDVSDNLVDHRQIRKAREMLTEAPAESCERLLDCYFDSSSNDKVLLDDMVNFFGAKYDLLSYLFFVRNHEKYVPARPSHIEKALQKKLDVHYPMSGKFGWENYSGYVDIIRQVQDAMNKHLELKTSATLLDAQSVVWIWCEDSYSEWENRKEYIEEAIYDEHPSPSKKQRFALVYDRNPEVSKQAKKLANGVCAFCQQSAPFCYGKDKKPYLEVHHVKWLCRGGKDSIENTVALCPNCHRRIHVLDNPEDTDKLMKVLAKRKN